MNDSVRKIEAVLFAVGDPISVKKLSGIIGESVEAVEQALSVLKEKYMLPSSGLHII
jgi:chromosome segregation and condensation protein ScpB